MAWLLVALLSGLVAGVGFWRGTTGGLGGIALPASAGVLFGLVMFRAVSLVKDRAVLGQQGGWPLKVAGALSLTATVAAGVDAVQWLATRAPSAGPHGLYLCIPAFVLLAISCLRLSLDSPRRTHFRVLALAAAANAVAASSLLVRDA